MDDTPLRPSNDPTPRARKGDSPFLPVVIASVVVLLVLLAVFLLFIKVKKEKVVPGPASPHSASLILSRVPVGRAAWTHQVELPG